MPDPLKIKDQLPMSATSNAGDCDEAVNKSPTLVGTKNWTMTKQSIMDLMGNFYSTYYVLNFYYPQRMPDFALTAQPANELFWLMVEEDKSADNSKYVALHKWAEQDCDYWTKLVVDMNNPVVISVQREPETSTKIKIMFSHGKTNSQVYTSNLCPKQQDAFLMFLVPLAKFKTHELALFSGSDYLKEYTTRTLKARESDENNEYIQCSACLSKTASVAFNPCGHFSFCAKCNASYKDTSCPHCRDQYISRHHCNSIASKCLVCPSVHNCKHMDCMIIPCGCIVGCKRYADHAIHVGDSCPNTKCGRVVDQTLKVFIKQ